MIEVRLSGTELRSSRIGFGASHLHHQLSSRARQRLLGAAWDCGVRYFDVAPYYGHGIAERELGRFLQGRRSEAVVATKFGLLPDPLLSRSPALLFAAKFLERLLPPGARRRSVDPARDYGAAQARSSVERSLRALRTDHIDLLYLHAPLPGEIADADTLLEALDSLRRAGKVRHFGIAGDAGPASAIARQASALAQVRQIDVGTLRDGCWPPGQEHAQVTFGHFRARSAGGTVPAKELSEELVWKQAVQSNPDGVILFHTRRAERIAHACGGFLAAQAGRAAP